MQSLIKTIVLLVGIALWIAPFSAIAENENVDEIVKNTNTAAYYSGEDGKSNVFMTITDAQKRTRTREFVILRKDVSDGGDQKFYVYFKKPSDVRKMVFMVHKHINNDDDRWLYLPALDLVKRIAASDNRTSFAGSDFFYEDVSGRSPDEDFHELIEVTNKYFVLENKPKNPDIVEFSSYKMWIDKKTWLPVKSEYLDKEKNIYRIIEALDIKEIQGIPTVVKARAADLLSKNETIIEFSNIK